MLLSLISLFLLSCKNESALSVNSENLDNDSLQVEFPNTLPVNQTFKGEIQYFSPLDSIKLSENANRFTFLYISTDTVGYEKLESIESSENYRAFFKENRDNFIPFEYSFTTLGDNFFSGIIVDEVILENYYGNGKGRIITHEVKLLVKVKVVE